MSSIDLLPWCTYTQPLSATFTPWLELKINNVAGCFKTHNRFRLIPPAAGQILTDKEENWEVLSAGFTESGEGGARKGWDVNTRGGGEKKPQTTMP